LDNNNYDKGISNSGNTVIGSETINVSEQRLQKIPPIYAKSLQKFSEIINQELQGQKISEQEKKEINNSIDEFAKEVENTKIEEGKENELTHAKKRILQGKLGSVIQVVLKSLPTAARIGSSLFVQLSQFSNVIGDKVEEIVDDYLQGS
jgi:transcriptional regulator of heat shock response